MITSNKKVLVNQDTGCERIFGVYPQKQQGLFLQRIKIFGGRLSWKQWRKVCEIASRYSKRSTIHISTRQDIELHDIEGTDIKNVQNEFARVNLTSYGACGDCVRNITVCSDCMSSSDCGDVFQVAKMIYEHLADYPCDLPRKFKISFSGCSSACGKPWLNDLGFVLKQNGCFSVIGAGSLGPRPNAGILLYENLVPEEILPMCLATLEFFKEYGNRENRSLARLRHVREKIGDEQFRLLLNNRFEIIRQSQNWPDITLDKHQHNLKRIWRLRLPNGNISINEAIQLADASEPNDAQLRINLEHGIELFGNQVFSLPDNLAALEKLPIIIACPGLSSCSKALTDTWAAADAIRHRIAGMKQTQKRICISGCPNSCAHSAAADIGLVGLRRKQNGRSVECFRLFTGGHNGTDNRLAIAVDTIFAKEVPEVIEKLLLSQ